MLNKQKLRVACLHGYGTNAKFLQRQMQSFKRAFSTQIQFIFLQGTFQAPKAFILDQKVIQLIDGPTRGWNPITTYKYNQKKYASQLLKPLQLYFNNKPFDGIVGFSQGATVTHLIIKLANLGKISWKGLSNLKFCILVCGSHWSWSELGIDNYTPIDLPSIHLASQADFLYRKSIFTMSQFKNPLIIHHPFGHVFPRLGTYQYNLIRKYIENAIKVNNKQQGISNNQSKL